MKFSAYTLVFTALFLSATGCSRGTNVTALPDSGIDPVDLGGATDSGRGPRDWTTLPSVDPCVAGCGPAELCGETGDGNGLDDDCDGLVDEGCVCTPGDVRPCFYGPPDRRNIGACTDGIQTCDEFAGWGGCFGGIEPSDEVCDGVDNDCDRLSDNGVPNCDTPFQCPSTEFARPLSTYTLNGTRIAPGATGWQWQITCPSTVSSCPAPNTPGAENTDVYFAQSGAYRVRASLIPAGETEAVSCEWTVQVQGDGLRIELDWDNLRDETSGVDLDLHVHRWTDNASETDWSTDDDCYYANCKPNSFSELTWDGHPDTDLENCADAPRGGAEDWAERGSCRNPRLDVDMNAGGSSCDPSVTDPNDFDYCSPENINIDNPIPGKPYRIMVHVWTGDVRTAPTVNIYCGGAIRGTFGADPIVYLNDDDAWLVADVVFVEGVCGADCRIFPLGDVQSGQDIPFGPAWSCQADESNETCN